MDRSFAEAELRDIRQKQDQTEARSNQITFDHLPDDQKTVVIDTFHDVALRTEAKMQSQRIYLKQLNNQKQNRVRRAKKLRRMQRVSRKRNR